jgi:hypothetical protein
MRKLVLLVVVMSLAACATPREPEILHTEFQDLKPISLDAKLPDRPTGVLVTATDGKEYVGFDLNNANALNTYGKQAEANTAALKTLVEAQNQTVQQRNLLTTLVRQQEDRGNMYSRLYTESQNQLESERRYNAIEKALMQALIVIGLAL